MDRHTMNPTLRGQGRWEGAASMSWRQGTLYEGKREGERRSSRERNGQWNNKPFPLKGHVGAGAPSRK